MPLENPRDPYSRLLNASYAEFIQDNLKKIQHWIRDRNRPVIDMDTPLVPANTQRGIGNRGNLAVALAQGNPEMALAQQAIPQLSQEEAETLFCFMVGFPCEEIEWLKREGKRKIGSQMLNDETFNRLFQEHNMDRMHESVSLHHNPVAREKFRKDIASQMGNMAMGLPRAAQMIQGWFSAKHGKPTIHDAYELMKGAGFLNEAELQDVINLDALDQSLNEDSLSIGNEFYEGTTKLIDHAEATGQIEAVGAERLLSMVGITGEGAEALIAQNPDLNEFFQGIEQARLAAEDADFLLGDAQYQEAEEEEEALGETRYVQAGAEPTSDQSSLLSNASFDNFDIEDGFDIEENFNEQIDAESPEAEQPLAKLHLYCVSAWNSDDTEVVNHLCWAQVPSHASLLVERNLGVESISSTVVPAKLVAALVQHGKVLEQPSLKAEDYLSIIEGKKPASNLSKGLGI
jgi:hypothetical protein